MASAQARKTAALLLLPSLPRKQPRLPSLEAHLPTHILFRITHCLDSMLSLDFRTGLEQLLFPLPHPCCNRFQRGNRPRLVRELLASDDLAVRVMPILPSTVHEVEDSRLALALHIWIARCSRRRQAKLHGVWRRRALRPRA
eukprot:scaffold48926_cov32-Tisochrysis_lutea.AAC.3